MAPGLGGIQTVPLSDALGVEMRVDGGPIAMARRLQRGDVGLAESVASALRNHLLVLIRNVNEADSGTAVGVPPDCIRTIHEHVHASRYPGLGFQRPSSGRPGWTDFNKKGATFPSFNETQILGSTAKLDLYGLQGELRSTSFWTRDGGQYHHDGAFSPASTIPPAIVGMTCEASPTACDPTTVFVYSNEQEGLAEDATPAVAVPCPAGATLFIPTLIKHVNASLLQRARRMRCVYVESFGRVLPPEYPIMSKSWITPVRQSPIVAERGEEKTKDAGYMSNTDTSYAEKQRLFEAGGGSTTDESYAHLLVQADEFGDDFIVCHTVCLDHLEEDISSSRTGECWQTLSWEDSQSFLERLLAPATSRMVAIDWRAGDLVLWDNLRTLHSVTPTRTYADSAEQRVMTRTSMQPERSLLS